MKTLPETSVQQRAINMLNSSLIHPIAQKGIRASSLNDIVNKLRLSSIRLLQYSDYLYSCEYYDWDYVLGAEYYKKRYFPTPTACSSLRKENFFARNFDWFYSEAVEFVVRMLPTKGRHGSIGIAQGHPDLIKTNVSTFEWLDAYELLPFSTQDGINDAGVVCNINVVPSGDKGLTTGTNPGKERFCAIMLCRYILDYANSAEHAIELINDLDIWCPNSKNLSTEVHFMIADATSTYVVEFVNNSVVVFSDQDDDYFDIPNNKPILTNFYYTDWDGQTTTGFATESGINPEETTLTAHASGVERYDTLSNAYSSLSSKEDIIDLMKSVRFTNAYSDSQSPFWYSEFVDGNATIYLPASAIQPIVDREIDIFNHRHRDSKTWQTTHTTIYDLSTSTLTVFSQEDYNKSFIFEL